MAKLIPFNTNQNSLFNTGFDEFYNMLDDFFSDGKPYHRSFARDTFKLDVKDNETEFNVLADLPGVKKEEVKIAMDDGKLSISINRAEENEEKKENYLHRERLSCSMTRGIYLGENTDATAIKAKLEDGVLKLTIPKKEKVISKVNVEIE